MIKTIPLNKLIASPRNVRRASDPQADLELKADIETRGLLQNLIVTSVDRPRGRFAVEGGERRRTALQALAQEGKLPKGHPVTCLVIERDDAQEASLAENFQRLSMNPADECLAFQRLIEQGADAEAIARRFGLNLRFVEGRLRLAGLADPVFEALGSGAISLEVAKAYAVTPDRERQAHVFEQVEGTYSANHADSIRRLMTQATISAGDRRALFVGEDAYVAAGGRIERDLFASEEQARWLDVALVERLATEKMDALAAEVAAKEGLGFVRPTLDGWISYGATDDLRRVHFEKPALTQDESLRVDELEEELGGFVAALDDDQLDEEERAQAEARISELDSAIAAIVDRPPVIDPELRSTIGAFLTLDERGQPRLDPNFYAPATSEAEPAGNADQGEVDTQDGEGAPAFSLSRCLVDELAMQRRDILAIHVASDPAFALDLAIFLMIDRDRHHWGDGCGSSLTASQPSNPVFDFKTPDAPATVARAQSAEALDRSWAGRETRAERFDAFRALGDEMRAAWLAHAVARTLEASANVPGERHCAFHDHCGELLGIDVAKWWRPTGANFFDRVPKTVTLAALAEIGGPALAERYAKAKKAELAQTCERIFAGDFIAEVEVKEAALTWVPTAMLFGSLAEPDENTSSDTPVIAEPYAEAEYEAPEPEEVEDAA